MESVDPTVPVALAKPVNTLAMTGAFVNVVTKPTLVTSPLKFPAKPAGPVATTHAL